MKINILHNEIILLLLLLTACVEEQISEPALQENVNIALTVDIDPSTRSSMLSNESLIRDLNIWIYSSSGQLVESHYLDGLSITSSGSLTVTTSAGGHSKLVLIGNAGRVLNAPSRVSDRARITMPYANDASALMLMVGEGTLSLTQTGMQSEVIMNRAMSRIALTVNLDPSLAADGGILGGNVRIIRAGFFNSPAETSLLPSEAWESVRTFKAVQGTSFSAGDCLSASDIATLHSGGIIYLYSLPNYTDIAYTDRPASATQYSSYIEMLLEFDGIGTVGEGRVLCRFYANDGAWIGLRGGCSYTCQVTVSNSGASNSWRKDDFRLDAPDSFLAGESKSVFLHSRNHDVQSVSFSLSETPGVNETAVFKIGEKVSDIFLQGVRVIAKSAGNGTLYCFNSNNEMMGQVQLNAIWPQISVSDKVLDVTGTEVPLNLQGLADAYSKRASDDLYTSLYRVASIAPLESVSGLYGQDFIYSGASDSQLYVDKLSWIREGVAKNWTDVAGKTFPYRVTLACGITADFNVSVVNGVVSNLRGEGYFGEAFDVSEIDSPLPAVAALANQNTISALVNADIPPSLNTQTKAQWQSNGWRSWFGGSLLEAGWVADSYVDSWSTGSIRWVLTSEALKSHFGSSIPLYIGKLNPHCGEYVREPVGYYASTIYHPIGIELYIERLATYYSEGQNNTVVISGTDDYSTNRLINFTTCLCFRPHSDGTVIDVESGIFAYQGRDGGSVYSNFTGIGSLGYAITNDGDYLETNWDGDLYRQSEFNYGAGQFFGTSAFGYNVRSPYNTSAYGAVSGRHLALFYYAPYKYMGGHAEIADSNGHVNAMGHVSVEKWSVSSKAFFDWREDEFVRLSPSGDL